LRLLPVDVFKATGGWVEEHCALLAVNVLHAALFDYQRRQNASADIQKNPDLSNEYHVSP